MNTSKNKRKANKRGVTNFEIIVALILFILAVFGSLAIYVSYFKNGPSSLETNNLDIFETNFMKHADNFTKVDAFVNLSGLNVPCFNISLNSNINGSFDNIYVLYNNSGTNFSLDTGNMSIGSNKSGIYELYLFSFNAIDKPSTSFSSCYPVSISYSIPLTGKIFSFDTLEGFNENYTDNYTNLKNQWDLSNDFAMTIKYENGTTLFDMMGEKPINTEVLSKSFIIEIFDENQGKIINALVTVQIW